jgi:hypothetical protein
MGRPRKVALARHLPILRGDQKRYVYASLESTSMCWRSKTRRAFTGKVVEAHVPWWRGSLTGHCDRAASSLRFSRRGRGNMLNGCCRSFEVAGSGRCAVGQPAVYKVVALEPQLMDSLWAVQGVCSKSRRAEHTERKFGRNCLSV